MRAACDAVPSNDFRILDLADDAIFLLTVEGRILFWNRGAEETYGWKKEEATGKISHNLLHTVFPQPLPEIMSHLRAENTWAGELIHTTKDGRVLTVSARWALQRDSDGRPSGFLEINRDITGARAAEEEQARLVALVESSDDAIVSKSVAGAVETWNPGAEQLYGYTRAEMLGRSIDLIVPPDRADEEVDIMTRIREGRRVGHFDTVRIRKDGTPVDISLTIFPIVDKTGRIIGASHVARDITERKRFENEIRALNESLERRVDERTGELAEANKELESFSYSVSHDLRTPLRSIDGFSRLLQEECAAILDGRAMERLGRIRAAVARMGQLIDGLLDLSRMGRAEIRRERVSLSMLAAHISRELERGAPVRKVHFVIQEGLTAMGDQRLIRALLENLLGNAFKFTARAGVAEIEFGANVVDGARVFFVKDNGVGFDMQYAGQLFRPFQRLHGRHEFEGTGIGLATAHRIVTRHGGRICADASPGRGASFYFTLGGEKSDD